MSKTLIGHPDGMAAGRHLRRLKKGEIIRTEDWDTVSSTCKGIVGGLIPTINVGGRAGDYSPMKHFREI